MDFLGLQQCNEKTTSKVPSMPLRWKLLELVCKYCCSWTVVPPQTVTTSPTWPGCPLQNSGITKTTSYFLSAEKWSIFYSIQSFSPKAFSTSSSCDSRNLNLSPFCNTSSTSLALWQPSVLETYGVQEKLDYLDKIIGPMRKKYPNSMGEREIIKSFTEVTIQILFSDNIMSPSNT